MFDVNGNRPPSAGAGITVTTQTGRATVSSIDKAGHRRRAGTVAARIRPGDGPEEE
ncbi:hypothetical protein ABNF97_21905 [Plantactinospora sp. B6F1]|uniref:hypothetical protein n=1 Tax=Plantactinospora sp. B6F1 TaxID=3158971 RepID=UPI0032D8D1E4